MELQPTRQNQAGCFRLGARLTWYHSQTAWIKTKQSKMLNQRRGGEAKSGLLLRRFGSGTKEATLSPLSAVQQWKDYGCWKEYSAIITASKSLFCCTIFQIYSRKGQDTVNYFNFSCHEQHIFWLNGGFVREMWTNGKQLHWTNIHKTHTLCVSLCSLVWMFSESSFIVLHKIGRK